MTTQPGRDSPAEITVGDYSLLSKIGEGGMGIVHLARKPGGDRVALKMLRPHIVGDDEARARLAREVNSLSRIRSRWVAEIVDADPWAPVPYVATRYVPGLPLHDHVVEEGPIEGADLVWFAACLAEGVASVHEVGVLHRDIKPSNVLMEGRTPILIDFGLARVADDPKLTHTGWLLGTPGYLAPEILYGDDATAASDVHSWAATVAYAATGNPPFGRGPSMAIMDRVRRGEHDLTGVPGSLHGVVAAALDPDPTRRPSLDALLEWLRPQTTRSGAAAAPAPVPEVEDMFTVPLALAAQAAGDAATEHVTDVRPRTLVMPTDVEPVAQVAPVPPAHEAPPAAYEPPLGPPLPPPSATRVEPEWEREWDAQHGLDPAAPPVSWTEKLRRGLLVGAGAVLTGAACAAAPWVAGALIVLAVWLLRSGSLAVTAVEDKRRLRGRKWYDGAQLVVRTPWHLVQSIPGTLMLVLWSAGLAVAAALICYAVAATMAVTLFVSGVVLTLSLWWGPGGSRVRGPLSRVVHPLSRGLGSWAIAMAVVGVVVVLLGVRLSADGVSWLPAGDHPFASYDLPDGGLLGP
ncbi:MAG: serine/threonine protein kinase [Actinomycetota bacterium]|nr:serine/threonine protein kinase [Actinomycetota bacterium]